MKRNRFTIQPQANDSASAARRLWQDPIANQHDGCLMGHAYPEPKAGRLHAGVRPPFADSRKNQLDWLLESLFSFCSLAASSFFSWLLLFAEDDETPPPILAAIETRTITPSTKPIL
jgi:hypothetical protein